MQAVDVESVAVETVDVLVIGAGVSGIGMACHLSTECPGKTFAILERRQRLGGTWDLFNYPGVRSDSDMLTYGFRFRPWHDAKVLADGATIRNYLVDTARDFGIDQKIRYGLKITRADWSNTLRRWTVTALDEASGETRTFRCVQLVMCTGYYNYDQGHTPAFPGIENYSGHVVHPQTWPQDLALAGKRVVVLGSGATAMTLVPALAPQAEHVTMLQRSPSYVLSVPSHDAVTAKLSRVLPKRWAFALARRRNTLLARWIYQACRRWPERMRKFLLKQTGKHLADTGTDLTHFSPNYMPWDQRLCIVPDADFFKALKSGTASVATDVIAGFSGRTIQLCSGKTLEADVLITATGLEVQVFGGTEIFVDGVAYDPQRHMLYKGALLEGLPNFAWIVGYTSLSWTLKADLLAAYLCRLFKHLDAHDLETFVAHDTQDNRTESSIMGTLSSGYVTRGNGLMPRQGRQGPWKVSNHYPSDKVSLLESPIDDGILAFERRRDGLRTAA